MIADCPTCVKARTHRCEDTFLPLEAHTTNAFEPFAVFQADFLTGLPVSRYGMTYILPLMCCFTRFAILYAYPDRTAVSACNGLLYLWGLFSVPQVLVTDGASAFVSEEFQALCNMLRVAHETTSPHHPQTHGIVEPTVCLFSEQSGKGKKGSVATSPTLKIQPLHKMIFQGVYSYQALWYSHFRLFLAFLHRS